MKKYLLLIVPLILAGCKDVSCDIDNEFKEVFFNNVKIIETSALQQEISADKLHGAFQYLEAVTGIKGQYMDMHYRIYKDEKAVVVQNV